MFDLIPKIMLNLSNFDACRYAIHPCSWMDGCSIVTNSRKHKDDYQWVAQLTSHDLQYLKLYLLQMCLLMSPTPPFTASTCGELRQLALEL